MGSVLKIVYDKWVTLSNNDRTPLPNGIHPIIYKLILDKTNSSKNIHQIITDVQAEIKGEIIPFDHSNFYGYTFRKLEQVDITQIDTDDVYVYPIEFKAGISSIYDNKEFVYLGKLIEYNLIETIDSNILTLMKLGKVKLLIHGAQDPYHCFNIDKLEKYFNNIGIDSSNIIFVPGNDINEDYKECYPNGKLKISAVPLMITQQCAKMATQYPAQTSLGYLSDLVREQDLDSNTVRPNRFLCLNRTMRPHRYAMAYIALKNDLLKNNIFTFLNSFNANKESIYEELLNFGFSDDECKKYSELIYNILPYELDTHGLNEAERGGISIANTKKEWYLNSYISIVTETSFIEGRKPFISEKLWRPVTNLQPFILVGNYGTLKTLKSLGFKTFDNFINESYDDVYDYKERMKRIHNEIVRLNNLPIKEVHDWYHSITDILIHNFQTLISLKDIDPYQILFDDLIDTYGAKT